MLTSTSSPFPFLLFFNLLPLHHQPTHRRRRSTPLLAAPFYAAGSAVRFALELVPALLALVAAGGAEAKARLIGGGVPSSSSFSPPLPASSSSSLRKRGGRGLVLGLAAAAAAANGIANLFLDAATRKKVAAVAEARGYPEEAIKRARVRGKRRVDPTALLSARRGMSEDLEGAGIGNRSGSSRGGTVAAEPEAKEEALAEAAPPPPPPATLTSSPPSSPPAYALRRPPLPAPPRNAFGDPLTLLVPPPVARYLRFALPGGSRPALRLCRATQTGNFRFRIATGLRPDEGWKRVTATQTWNACASTPGYCWAATVRLAPGLWVRGWDALCGEYSFVFLRGKIPDKKNPKKLISSREKKKRPPKSQTGGRGHMYWRLLGSLPLIDSDAAGAAASAAAEAAKAEATEAAAREAAARAAAEGRSPPAPPRPPQEVPPPSAASAAVPEQLVSPLASTPPRRCGGSERRSTSPRPCSRPPLRAAAAAIATEEEGMSAPCGGSPSRTTPPARCSSSLPLPLLLPPPPLLAPLSQSPRSSTLAPEARPSRPSRTTGHARSRTALWRRTPTR